MAFDLNPRQTKSLVAAWLGWAFDGLDGYLYVMVAAPFVSRLVAAEHGVALAAIKASKELSAETTTKASIIQAMFLVGWALGGAVFGRIGDRLGRSRTLTLTILTYACCTGLSFFATRWWHLLIFRFLAALGIGGEWAAGSALVCETLHPRHRAWASALLQSGYMIGCIAAALASDWMAMLEPRWVFLVGVVPALLTLWIRAAVPEPEEWTRAAVAAKGTRMPGLRSLFSKELRSTTLLATGLCAIALTTVWGFIFFGPMAIRAAAEHAGAIGAVAREGAGPGEWEAAVRRLVSRVTITFMIVNIGANFFATYLAKVAGYRWAFASMFAASMGLFLVIFRGPLSLGSISWSMSIAGFFALGVFGIFPLYIPRLFPTLLRTLGAGFTYNVGRLISGVGAYFGGVIAAHAAGGGAHAAIWWTGLLFIPGVALALVAPRPRFALDEGECA